MLQITHPDTIMLNLQHRRHDSMRAAAKHHLIKQVFKDSLPSSFKRIRIPNSLCILRKTASC